MLTLNQSRSKALALMAMLLLLPAFVLASEPVKKKPLPACPGMTLTISGTDVLCNGGNSGTAQVQVTGGSEPITYLWSTGPTDTTGSVTGLTAGVYSVIVTDSTGCSDTAQITINQPAALSLSTVVTNASCPSSMDGSINLTVSGGTLPYSFNWVGGPGTEDRNNVGAGSYQVIVTDANGCMDSITSVVNAPTAWNVSSSVTDALCPGGNGSVDVTVSGATPPYSYSWTNGATTQDLSAVVAGTYVLTITDNSGCTFQVSSTVSEPSAISISSVVTNVSCSGGSTGAIDISVIGGTGAYSYLWSNGATTQDINGLTAGNYTVTVTDANSCTASSTITVNAAGPLTLTYQATNVSCNGAGNGAINLTVSGGTSPYTFAWTNGATSEDISSLAPGTYGVTVTDAAGCQNSVSVVISQPSALTLSQTPVHITCNGQSNGSIDLTVSGGTSPYTYAWSNGATSQDINSLSAGTYSVTVTDANGCTSVLGTSITEPGLIALNSIVTPITCNGTNTGSINLLVSGGVQPYSYSWSNGSSVEDPAGLAAGSYTVTVTDANGCTASHTATVTQPAVLTLSTSATNATCAGVNNGAIDLQVTGGTGPFTYQWAHGPTSEDLSGLSSGTYSVTVTDSKNCTATTSANISAPSALTLTTSSTPSTCGGTTGSASVSVSGGTSPYTYLWTGNQTTSSISNVGAGTYSVTVTDNSGCATSASVTVATSSGFAVSSSVTNAACSGSSTGSVDITPTGGSGTYTYTWSNGATTQDISSVPAGSYSVTVSDGSCSFFLSAVVTQPTAVIITPNVINPSCNGGSDGSIDITVSGGTGSYTYAWSNGATTQDITALTAGTYSLTVTDANGCTASSTHNIMNPPALSTSLFITNVACNGGSSGSTDLTVFGGVPPYTYAWNTGATTQDLTGLNAGSYSVTVTDAAGCTSLQSGTVTQPQPLSLSYNVTHVNCNGGAYGSIDLTVTGGTPNYQYSWTGGLTSQDIGGLSGGNYTVQVTDAMSCTSVISITVNEPDSITSTVSSTPATCGNPDGSATVVAGGGVAPYTYSWNDPAMQTTATATNLQSGPYGITITDANGCFHSNSVIVGSTGGPVVSAVTTDVTCAGAKNGSVNLSVTGGTTPYGFAWSNTSTTEDIAGLNPGYYFVTVSDANNCTDTLTAFIDEPDSLKLSGTVTNVFCAGDTTGAIDVTVTGGTGQYNYFWTPDMGNVQDLSGLSTGSYALQIADSNLCIAFQNFTVIALSSPVEVSVSILNETCTGQSDGSIRAIASGGSAPYSYSWNTGETTSSLVDVPGGDYVVIVTDFNGCESVGGGKIEVKSQLCDSLFIPSAFSPNGDGVNDTWIIRNISKYSSSIIQVFNRWGSEIFSSNGYAVPWDGTFGGDPVSAGTYYYVVKLTPESEAITGTITIVR